MVVAHELGRSMRSVQRKYRILTGWGVNFERKPWTKKEDELLLDLVEKARKGTLLTDWETLSIEMGRSADALRLRYRSLTGAATSPSATQNHRKAWTFWEDEALVTAVLEQPKVKGRTDFESIGNHFGRSAAAVQYRWMTLRKAKDLPDMYTKNRAWTDAEDAQVRKAVLEGRRQGRHDYWSKLAGELGRAVTSIQARWKAFREKSVENGEPLPRGVNGWTEAEDASILQTVEYNTTAIRQRLYQFRKREGTQIGARAWTHEQDEILLQELENHTPEQIFSSMDVVKGLGRSAVAIRKRLLQLGKREGMNVRGRLWTNAEDECLLRSVKESTQKGQAVDLMGLVKQMGRSDRAIRERLLRLRKQEGTEIRGRVWTKEEDDCLLETIQYGTRKGQIINLDDLVKQLGRPASAIRNRLSRLRQGAGLGILGGTFQRWTKEEDDALLQSVEYCTPNCQILNLKELVQQTGRSASAVQSRLSKLRQKRGKELQGRSWTAEEDKILWSAIDGNRELNVSTICQVVAKKLHRSHLSSKLRYHRIKNRAHPQGLINDGTDTNSLAHTKGTISESTYNGERNGESQKETDSKTDECGGQARLTVEERVGVKIAGKHLHGYQSYEAPAEDIQSNSTHQSPDLDRELLASAIGAKLGRTGLDVKMKALSIRGVLEGGLTMDHTYGHRDNPEHTDLAASTLVETTGTSS
ncbi:hypothetical protein HDV00_012412 [Rhizophlyctis rosea]|nr:hypothetical protein HDV00_012412 [Rhizophlyctis rosea]